jgi:hypothetical protein
VNSPRKEPEIMSRLAPQPARAGGEFAGSVPPDGSLSRADGRVSPIIELADRHSSDLDVTLYWERRSGSLWVFVTHRHSGRSARIDATPRNALDVFHHPFAYVREAA